MPGVIAESPEEGRRELGVIDADEFEGPTVQQQRIRQQRPSNGGGR